MRLFCLYARNLRYDLEATSQMFFTICAILKSEKFCECLKQVPTNASSGTKEAPAWLDEGG